MTINMSKADRGSRLIAAVAIAVAIALGAVSGAAAVGLAAVAAILALTGVLRSCPLYALLGVATQPPAHQQPAPAAAPVLKQLAPAFFVTAQLSPDDLPAIAAQGFKAIICNRPDHEAPSQATEGAIRGLAQARGLDFAYVPVAASGPTADDAALMRAALDTLPGPVLAYCRSGARSSKVWEMAQSLPSRA